MASRAEVDIGAGAWTRRRTAGATIHGTPRAADKAWVLAYLLSRGLRFLPSMTSPRDLQLEGIPGRLRIDPRVGGLSTYYEIVCAQAYARDSEFIPTRGACVVDVGANSGMYSRWAAAHVGSSGRIIAIEPHPRAVEVLRVNLAGAGCPVDVVQAACGAAPGTATLRFSPGRLSTATLVAGADSSEAVSVALLPLDDVLRSLGVGAVDVLKIDVEGWEAGVLQGATQSLAATQRVVLEVDDASWPEVRELLAVSGLTEVGRLSGIWAQPELSIVYAART
jgi:FkbM family methyltransferase